jgi:stage V sporulation protein S
MSSETRRNNVMRVGTYTDPKSLASAIYKALVEDEEDEVTMRAVGAAAANQACKATAIARGFVAPRGHDLVAVIGFEMIIGNNGGEITAMTFRLFSL